MLTGDAENCACTARATRDAVSPVESETMWISTGGSVTAAAS
jgi:hypothetical protein